MATRRERPPGNRVRKESKSGNRQAAQPGGNGGPSCRRRRLDKRRHRRRNVCSGRRLRVLSSGPRELVLIDPAELEAPDRNITDSGKIAPTMDASRLASLEGAGAYPAR